MGMLSGENPQDVAERFRERTAPISGRCVKNPATLKQKIQHWFRRQRYARYRRQFEERISLAQKLWDWAQSEEIDLLALNIQYCMRDPRITATLMGAATPSQIEADVAAAQKEIPEWVWQALPGMGVTLPVTWIRAVKTSGSVLLKRGSGYFTRSFEAHHVSASAAKIENAMVTVAYPGLGAQVHRINNRNGNKDHCKQDSK